MPKDLERLRDRFTYALRGVRMIYRSEQSFRIQVLFAALALLLSFVLHIRRAEFIVVLLLIGSVLVLEMINSVLEKIVDTFKPRVHPAVRDLKDMMAGTVLVASLISAIVGLVIFLPRIIAFFV